MENYYMDLKYYLADGTWCVFEASIEGTVDFYIKDSENSILSHQSLQMEDVDAFIDMFLKMKEYLTV